MPIPSLNEAEIKCITKASKTLQEQRQQESVETSKNKILLLNAKKEDDHWVNLSEARLRHECMGGLYAGSLFTGIQKCGPTDYEVTVELKVSVTLASRYDIMNTHYYYYSM
jgi:hypothetical protein